MDRWDANINNASIWIMRSGRVTTLIAGQNGLVVWCDPVLLSQVRLHCYHYVASPTFTPSLYLVVTGLQKLGWSNHEFLRGFKKDVAKALIKQRMQDEAEQSRQSADVQA